MHTGQLSLGSPFDAADQRATRANVANDDSAEATFALLFETALGISDRQCSEIGASNDSFDMDNGDAGSEASFDSRDLGPVYNSGAIGRLMFQARPAQLVFAAGPNLNDPQNPKTFRAEALGTRAQQIECVAQPPSPNGNLASPANASDAFNKSELSDWMDAHALTRSSHHCAMYCRLGMEAAGLNTADRPQSGDAGDYGPFLLRHGAQTISPDSYIPQVGDVVVFDKTSQHPFGHIEMYDGHHWVSDFMQHNISPYRDANSAPPFTIYRLA
jgi:hypothetical protein